MDKMIIPIAELIYQEKWIFLPVLSWGILLVSFYWLWKLKAIQYFVERYSKADEFIINPEKYFFAEEIHETPTRSRNIGKLVQLRVRIELKRSQRWVGKDRDKIKKLLCEIANRVRKIPDHAEKILILDFSNVRAGLEEAYINAVGILIYYDFALSILDKNGLIVIFRYPDTVIKPVQDMISNIEKLQNVKRSQINHIIKFEKYTLGELP